MGRSVMQLLRRSRDERRSARDNELDIVRVATTLQNHMDECERSRAEDVRTQAERHLENTRRLDAQDRAIASTGNAVNAMRSEQNAQFLKLLWTIIGGFASLASGLGYFILSHIGAIH